MHIQSIEFDVNRTNVPARYHNVLNNHTPKNDL
jgi:hypothetical protein